MTRTCNCSLLLRGEVVPCPAHPTPRAKGVEFGEHYRATPCAKRAELDEYNRPTTLVPCGCGESEGLTNAIRLIVEGVEAFNATDGLPWKLLMDPIDHADRIVKLYDQARARSNKGGDCD